MHSTCTYTYINVVLVFIPCTCRFEVQIEVSLPDEEGRREIFEIHTRDMRSSGMLAEDVDPRQLAANTTRFSGAEIAGVVRAASSYALERYVSTVHTCTCTCTYVQLFLNS